MQPNPAPETFTGLHLLALAFALGQPSAGLAQAFSPAPAEPGSPKTQLSVGAGTARYVAEERLPNGSLFNREDGDLLRGTVELRHARADWTWTVAQRRSHGTLDYNGQTQIGLPLHTLTDLERQELGVGVEHAWTWHDGAWGATLGVGAEQLRTRRHIRGTLFSGELTETLKTRQWLLNAGAFMATQVAAQRLRLGGTLQVSRPWWQTLDVDTHGLAGTFALEPASRWANRIGLDATWAIGEVLQIATRMGLETYRPGPGAQTTPGSASYPGSVQKSRFVDASLIWCF